MGGMGEVGSVIIDSRGDDCPDSSPGGRQAVGGGGGGVDTIDAVNRGLGDHGEDVTASTAGAATTTTTMTTVTRPNYPLHNHGDDSNTVGIRSNNTRNNSDICIGGDSFSTSSRNISLASTPHEGVSSRDNVASTYSSLPNPSRRGHIPFCRDEVAAANVARNLARTPRPQELLRGVHSAGNHVNDEVDPQDGANDDEMWETDSGGDELGDDAHSSDRLASDFAEPRAWTERRRRRADERSQLLSSDEDSDEPPRPVHLWDSAVAEEDGSDIGSWDDDNNDDDAGDDPVALDIFDPFWGEDGVHSDSDPFVDAVWRDNFDENSQGDPFDFDVGSVFPPIGTRRDLTLRTNENGAPTAAWTEVDEERIAGTVAWHLSKQLQTLFEPVLELREIKGFTYDEMVRVENLAVDLAARDTLSERDRSALDEIERDAFAGGFDAIVAATSIDGNIHSHKGLPPLSGFGHVSASPGAEPHPMWAAGWLFPSGASSRTSLFTATIRLLGANPDRRSRYFANIRRCHARWAARLRELHKSEQGFRDSCRVLALMQDFVNSFEDETEPNALTPGRPFPSSSMISAGRHPWPGDWAVPFPSQLQEGDVLDGAAAPDRPTRFVITGQSKPLQWSYSPSRARHFQTAKSLCLGELELVSVLLGENQKGCDRNSNSATLWMQRPWTAELYGLNLAGANRIQDLRHAYIGMRQARSALPSRKRLLPSAAAGFGSGSPFGMVVRPDVFSYTRYLVDPLSAEGGIVQIRFVLKDTPLCVDAAYGFLAVGGEHGCLQLFCMADRDRPDAIPISSRSSYGMCNSVQISRRRVMKECGNCNWSFEYTLVVAMNEGGVDILLISEHDLHANLEAPRPSLTGFSNAHFHPENCRKICRLKAFGSSPEFHAAARDRIDESQSGTTSDIDEGSDSDWDSYDDEMRDDDSHGELSDASSPNGHPTRRWRESLIPVNDARISPNNRFLAAVGDNSLAFLAKITYGEATRATVEGGCADDPKLSRTSIFDEDAISEDPTVLPERSFSDLKPISVAFLVRDREGGLGLSRHGWENTGEVTMQYLSWSCNSRYFAASSDNIGYLFVFDAERDGAIVLCVPTESPALAIAFHPTNPYILAYAEKISNVHVIDLYGPLSGSHRPPQALTPATPPRYRVYQHTLPRQTLRHGHFVPLHGLVVDVDGASERVDGVGRYPHGEGGTSESTSGGAGSNNASSNRGNRPGYQEVSARINGVEWSDDGRWLYVATKRRVVTYECCGWILGSSATGKGCGVESLNEVCLRRLWWEGEAKNRSRQGRDDPKATCPHVCGLAGAPDAVRTDDEERQWRNSTRERAVREWLEGKRWAGHWRFY
ncbi:hypothetical protein DFJ73DRAFT_805681 [Zopfochytrium polystomum]|nr:hypothetical protein DFJ73DRAFT_805681 [Zopfochytrium polystomum]